MTGDASLLLPRFLLGFATTFVTQRISPLTFSDTVPGAIGCPAEEITYEQ